MSVTLIISDYHAPFENRNALDFLSDLRRQIKPTSIVSIGDEIDAHGWGRWQRHPDSPGQRDELSKAVRSLKRLYKLFPRVSVCHSNHTLRAAKTSLRAGLPGAFLREMGDVLEAPRTWVWKQSWTLNGVLYKHGDGFSGMNAALNAARAARGNTVIGHIHAWAGVQYHTGERDTIFGMNVGCLIDPEAIAFEYAANTPNKATLGTGAILDGVPMFFPMR